VEKTSKTRENEFFPIAESQISRGLGRHLLRVGFGDGMFSRVLWDFCVGLFADLVAIPLGRWG
jgi:hypothetical protein